MIHPALILSLLLTTAAPSAASRRPAEAVPPARAEQDSIGALRRAAGSAAFYYEALLRRRAPETLSAPVTSDRCDEIIGRFCFRFGASDEPDPPPPPEHPSIHGAREQAVFTHRRWLSADPADGGAAGPLVRYLIEGGRPAEAVAVARTHAWAARRTPASLLLLGLALHYAADFVAAEAAFDSARALLSDSERRRLDDIEPLLDPADRKLYRGLDGPDREPLEARFWALSDPSLLDPGNERRSAHYARRAWISILEDAPRAQGMVSWGKDHEQIVLRYGLPVSRERLRQRTLTLEPRLSMIESYDPHAVSLVPDRLLTRGLPDLPAPGRRHELERDTARAIYAPIRRSRLRALHLQPTLLPNRAGAILRVDGVLQPDTSAPRAPRLPVGILAVLDTLGREYARVRAETRIREDSAALFSARIPLPPGTWLYRAELADRESTPHAALAQYRVEIPDPVGLRVSDLLVAEAPDSAVVGEDRRADPGSDLDPIPDLRLRTDQAVLLYAEVVGLARVGDAARLSVEWWIEDADGGSLLGRAAGWVGRRLGISSDEGPTRVRWEEATTDDPARVAFVLDLRGAGDGLRRLGLTVRDLVSGDTRTVRRLVLLEPPARPLVSRGGS